MEPQPINNPAKQITPAHTVWETLTDVQKESVRQSLIQVCQQLVAQSKDEATDEPASDPV